MLRYSLYRLGVFVACLVVAWALVLRTWPIDLRDQTTLWTIFAAAIVSAVLSLLVLKPQRERFSRQIEHRVEAHMRHNADQEADVDTAAEDAEAERFHR